MSADADSAVMGVELLRRTLLRSVLGDSGTNGPDTVPGTWPVAEKMALLGAAMACAGFCASHPGKLFTSELSDEELATLAGVYEIASRAVLGAEILAKDCCSAPSEFEVALKSARAGAPALRKYLFERLSRRCPAHSSVTGQECTLVAGHPCDSPTRFHKFGKA